MRQITLSFCKQAGMTLFALFCVLNTNAWAGKIFNWKSESGLTNFTDYRSGIPVKHRDQIKDKVEVPKIVFPESTLTESALAPAEPMPEKGSPEGEQGKEGATGEKEKETGEPPKEKPKPTLKPEAIKLLVAALDFLEKENTTYRRYMKSFKFNKTQGRHIIKRVTRQIPPKKALIQKIEVSNRKSLQEVNDFLGQTLPMDEKLEIGGKGYLERLDALKTRMEEELILKENLISAVKKDLAKGGVDEELIQSYRPKR